MFGYDLWPLAKILSVPNDATAHIRRAHNTAMIVVSWPEAWPNVSPEKPKTAKIIAMELLNIVLSGEDSATAEDKLGYGNHSKLSSVPRSPEWVYAERVAAYSKR